MEELSASETLGHVLYYWEKVRPQLPTYFFLIVLSILPIYTGAHASLHRPVSAAKPRKKKDDEGPSLEVHVEEETNMMQGFEWSDVVLYPVLAGGMLAGLYWLITYLEEAAIAIITGVLNAYMSVFGLVGIFAFLSDGVEALASYVFPSCYWEAGRLWVVDGRRRTTLPAKMGPRDVHPGRRASPWPAPLRTLGLPDGFAWWLRGLTARPAFVLELQVLRLVTKVRPTPSRIMCAQVAVAAVVYYNLVDRAWWLTNLLGFSFTYSAFQILSPTTFKIGTMLLSALLCYDIYMVFFTPMMITVATKLDIPAKIMIPNPDMEGKRAFSMLGLGDIVIPGMIIALALRFDFYMFYLKRQRVVTADQGGSAQASEEEGEETVAKIEKSPNGSSNSPKDHADKGSKKTEKPAKRYLKEVYTRGTGAWGDRFWLGKHANEFVGGGFPKVYFWAGIVGYLAGLVVTLAIVTVFDHGQPALLYLVPGVLGAMWSTALVRGEAGVMWKYTEDPDDGRKAEIDSAAILGNDTLLKQHQDSRRPIEMGARTGGPYEQNSASQEATAAVGEADTKENPNQIASTLDDADHKTAVSEADGKTKEDVKEPSTDKTEPKQDVGPGRCIFKLVISLPSPPPLTTASSRLPNKSKKGLEGAAEENEAQEEFEQSTVNLADGEPFEKRRRIV